MDPNLAKFNAFLGPLLGFLFTAGTLLFIAFNAQRTAQRPEAGQPAAEPPAGGL